MSDEVQQEEQLPDLYIEEIKSVKLADLFRTPTPNEREAWRGPRHTSEGGGLHGVTPTRTIVPFHDPTGAGRHYYMEEEWNTPTLKTPIPLAAFPKDENGQVLPEIPNIIESLLGLSPVILLKSRNPTEQEIKRATEVDGDQLKALKRASKSKDV
jgi:hypothetical protein